MKYKISAHVIRRLPRYIRQLDALLAAGMEKVSSGELGRIMGLTASQIRQDINCFGGFGQQGYGYNIRQLRDGISSALGIQIPLTAIIIGAGNLGHALISNFRFDECGVTLTAAFDVSPSLVGTSIAGVPVLHIEELAGYIRDTKTDLAVLTVPKQAAVQTAELAAGFGIKGIWNFTGEDLISMPSLSETEIENVHFSDSLLYLGYCIRGGAAEREQ